jgi:hypothetical protein
MSFKKIIEKKLAAEVSSEEPKLILPPNRIKKGLR